MTEKQVQADAKKLLALASVTVYDTSQPFRALIAPGVPDLLCFCRKRGIFFVEVKAPGGKQSAAQKGFQALCERAGVPYVLGGVEAVASFLGASM